MDDIYFPLRGHKTLAEKFSELSKELKKVMMKTEFNDKERRQYKRKKVQEVGAAYRLVDPLLWAESRSRGTNCLDDISINGASFKSDDCLPRNTVVRLDLCLDSSFKIAGICGKIVRVRQLEASGYEIGVTFSWWEKEEDKKNLRSFLEKKV